MPISEDALYLSRANNQLLLTIVATSQKVTKSDVLNLFNSSKYKDFRINKRGVTEATVEYQKAMNKVESITDEPVKVIIADRIDAIFSIEVAPNLLSATAKLVSAYAGDQITTKYIKNELIKHGITTNIQRKSIHNLVEKAKKSKPGSKFKILIAKGVKELNGNNTQFISLVKTEEERTLAPQINESGKANMRNLGQISVVKANSKLMQLIPHVEGYDGIKITGEVIPHTSGKELSFEVGKNTYINSENENLLMAKIFGIPHLKKQGMEVSNLLSIENVDIKQGNIDFDGDVAVNGNICEGMTVKSTGNITVSGFIESANIECDGDLEVKNGILGHNIEDTSDIFSCTIKVAGNIKANICQYAYIETEKDLIVNSQLLHCEVHAGDKVIVGNEAQSKGTILGGKIRANNLISAIKIGSKAGTRTEIDLVGVYTNLIDESQALFDKISDEEKKIQQILTSFVKVKKLPKGEIKKLLKEDLNLRKEKQLENMTKLSNENDENEKKLEKYFLETKFVAVKNVYSDVAISIGKEAFHLTKAYNAMQIKFQDPKFVIDEIKN